MKELLTVASSPHIKRPDTTRGIMSDVVIALAPAATYGCILFGLRALAVLITSVSVAVLCEFLWNKALKKPNTIKDMSAVVTGLLLGMNLPPTLPLWQAAIGSAAAIIVVKQMFGGLGHNFANPAIAARIILLVSFPASMTRFTEPVSDAVTSATPLAGTAGTLSFKTLFFGMHAGSIGETSAFLLIVGGLYLVIRRVITPIIPVCFIGTVALLSLISGESVMLSVFGGGLILGDRLHHKSHNPARQGGFRRGLRNYNFRYKKIRLTPRGRFIFNFAYEYFSAAYKPFHTFEAVRL